MNAREPTPAEVARRRRRMRIVNLALLLLVVPTVAAASVKLTPLVGAPVLLLLKVGAFAVPSVLVLLVSLRVKRR